MESIFLDYNGATPIDPRIADAVLPYIHEHFGNPSSSHGFGAKPRMAFEKARSLVGVALGCRREEIFSPAAGRNPTIMRSGEL